VGTRWRWLFTCLRFLGLGAQHRLVLLAEDSGGQTCLWGPLNSFVLGFGYRFIRSERKFQPDSLAVAILANFDKKN